MKIENVKVVKESYFRNPDLPRYLHLAVGRSSKVKSLGYWVLVYLQLFQSWLKWEAGHGISLYLQVDTI